MGDPVLNRIRMVSLRVRNKSKAEEWYTKKLGLQVLWRNESTIGLQAKESWGTVVVLVEAADPLRFEQETVIHFTASNIHEAYEKVKASSTAYVEQIQTSGSTAVFCYHDHSGPPTMIWSELNPIDRSEEIANLISRFVPVLA
ncbi:MAG: VOC family protein [Bacillota bacterium]